MIFYSVAMIAAGTLAAIGYASFDIRFGLAAFLVAAIGWLYDLCSTTARPND